MDKKEEIKARGRYLPISFKHSVEIGRTLKGMNVKKAVKLLEDVISLKKPIKFKSFNKDMGHKKGISAGRYPVKASKEIKKILVNLIANASNKYFEPEDLTISKFIVNRGVSKEKMATRRMGKSTHIEIIAIPTRSSDKKNKSDKKKKEEKIKESAKK